jgi:sulfopropanediol 3-dehydrogenase
VPEKLKRDIEFAHANVKRFAEAQKATVADFELEVVPGLSPGRRRSRSCSGLLRARAGATATSPRDHDGDDRQGRGLRHIVACSPPVRACRHRNPAIVYAANICGADKILAMGGVQGVAAMAFGLFGLPKANILVGPGNQFVAEAKRILFGRVGIDMIAGPTDSLILADKAADPMSWPPIS